jgi:hypothetical protein
MAGWIKTEGIMPLWLVGQYVEYNVSAFGNSWLQYYTPSRLEASKLARYCSGMPVGPARPHELVVNSIAWQWIFAKICE